MSVYPNWIAECFNDVVIVGSTSDDKSNELVIGVFLKSFSLIRGSQLSNMTFSL